jgi:hypothetical protein
MSLRNILIAGTIAIGTAFSAGTASAATDLSIPTASESGVVQVYHGYNYNYGQRRLCYVPFYKLVQYVGFWRAKQIKRNCYTPYYGYNNYKSY